MATHKAARKAVQVSEPSFESLKELQKDLYEYDSVKMSLGDTIRWLVNREIGRRLAAGTWQKETEHAPECDASEL